MVLRVEGVERGWEAAVEGYCGWLLAGGASRGTVRLRRRYVERLGESTAHDPWTVDPETLLRMLATEHWSPETRKSARSAIRSFYRWAHAAGLAPDDPSVGLPSVFVPQGQPRPTPRHVVTAALARSTGRDRLMILLAVLAGLRRSEIARVHSRDVTPDLIGYSLRVTGKGGRVRVVPLHAELVEALTGLTAGFVFPGKDNGHLSPDWVGRRLTRMLGPGWSGHSLRHRFASDAYAVERDLFAVQRLLGHTKPTTTAIYTAIPHTSLRTAVDGMDWPAA